MPLRRITFSVGALLAALVALGCSGDRDDAADESDDGDGLAVLAIDGDSPFPRWRVAWVQAFQDPGDPFLAQWGHRLCVAESDDKGESGPERVLVSGPENFIRPLITPDGESVLFSQRQRGVRPPKRDYKIYQVPFSGGDPVLVGAGFACDLWQDPGSGKPWVLAAEEVEERGVIAHASRLVRFPLGSPDKRETVWDSTKVTLMNVQISGDGGAIAGTFPWPNGGIANLETKGLEKTHNGCWAGIAPDDSRLSWVFDGLHRNLRLVIPDSKSHSIPVNTAPGMNGFEVYHPRWSNTPRFFTCTGPFQEGGGGNRIGLGGAGVEVYLGRFDNGFTQVERWVQVTKNAFADFAPSLWVDKADAPGIDLAAVRAAGETVAAERKSRDVDLPEFTGDWPWAREGLVFLWDNNRSANSLRDAEGKVKAFNVVAHGAARFGRYHEMDTRYGGHFEFGEPLGEEIVRRIGQTSQFSLEAIVRAHSGETGDKSPKPIISISSSDERNLTLSQEGGEFHLRVRTPKSRVTAEKTAHPFGKVEPGMWQHVLVSYRHGEVHLYVDGEDSLSKRGIYEDLRNWIPMEPIFGEEWGGGGHWAGSIEAVAFYDRFIGADEAEQRFRLAHERTDPREELDPMVTKATLRESTGVPGASALGTYQRHLSAYIYDIHEGVLAGEQAIVYHWTVLDGKPVPGFPREEGKTYTIHLEPFESHPQLTGESMDPPEDFALEVFLDVSELTRS